MQRHSMTGNKGGKTTASPESFVAVAAILRMFPAIAQVLESLQFDEASRIAQRRGACFCNCLASTETSRTGLFVISLCERIDSIFGHVGVLLATHLVSACCDAVSGVATEFVVQAGPAPCDTSI